jgi:hypothetical protein
MSNLLVAPQLNLINGVAPSTFWSTVDNRYNLTANATGITLTGSAVIGDRLYGNFTNTDTINTVVTLSDSSDTQLATWTVLPSQQIIIDYTMLAATTWTLQVSNEDIENITARLSPIAIPSTPSWPVDPGGALSLGVKLFASIGDMASNASRTVAQIGELSTYSETFSRDRMLSSGSFVVNPQDPQSIKHGLHQSIFSSKTNAGAPVILDNVVLEFLEELNAWIYASGLRSEFTNNSETTRQLLIGGSVTPLYNLEIGAMVLNATKYYPESISFIITKAALIQWYTNKYGSAPTLSDTYNRTQVKVWYSDRAFRAQYDEYQIDIIAPIDVIDDFYRTASAVNGLVRAVTSPILFNKIRDKADKDPYTEVKAMEFDWYDPLTLGNKIRTVWSFVIYGNAGLSVDAIKETLRNWILDNTTHTREEWTAIFPDIFRSTEFIFMPMWNRYAIPNMTTAEGVYSPILDYQDAVIAAGKVISGLGYTTAHLVNRLAFVGTPYKSIAMMVCGGPENRVGAYAINQVWPDYLSVPTSSVDFNRMQPSTQTWVNTLQRLVRTAEEATEFSEIPTGFSRIRRQNPQNQTVTYIATTVDNIQYMAVTKTSMLALVPATDYGVTPDNVPLSLLPAPDITIQTVSGSRELSIDFEAIGGIGPYTYSIQQTSAMVAAIIGPATGQCEVEYTNFGIFPLRVTVEDSIGNEYVGVYEVNVRV